ncbi:MAG: hypothetical protein WC477_03770 [Patescibacteria group bacterium]
MSSVHAFVAIAQTRVIRDISCTHAFDRSFFFAWVRTREERSICTDRRADFAPFIHQ